MAGIKDFAKGRSDVFMVDPADLQIEEGWNVRQPGPELDVHIRTLADSIKQVGVKEPMTIYMKDGVPVVTNGWCRFTAVRLAISEGSEIRAVPVRVEERYSSEADRVLSMITRNSGKPLTSLETAEVVKRLLAFGWTKPEVCKKTGYSESHINNLLDLSGMDVKIVKMVKEGSISPSLAINTVREHGEQRAAEVMAQAVESVKKVGKTRATAKDMTTAPPKVNWNTWGPKLYDSPKVICETRIKDPGFGELVANAAELIENIGVKQ